MCHVVSIVVTLKELHNSTTVSLFSLGHIEAILKEKLVLAGSFSDPLTVIQQATNVPVAKAPD